MQSNFRRKKITVKYTNNIILIIISDKIIINIKKRIKMQS